MSRFSFLLTTCYLVHAVLAAPASQPHFIPLDDGAKTPDPNLQLWNAKSTTIPEPVRGKLGAPILGPENIDLERQNADLLTPPKTDHGQLENLKWPFSLSHNRLSEGGWAREQNGKLAPLLSKGDVRISTVTPEGQVYVGDVSEGDLWYFPAGFPHSIQAKNTTGLDGAEFLLIFDSGHFSEDATFLLTDWLTHVPKSVLAKNFGVTDLTTFDHIPEKELYIFPSPVPPEDPTADMAVPNNTPYPYTYALSKIEPTNTPGGSIKVVDSSTFKVADKISAVEVVVGVGGMRELHWHPTQPEWTFYMSDNSLNHREHPPLILTPRSSGEARVTVFASSTNARTYNFQSGDVGYVPPSYGHYVENAGDTPLKFLEVFQGGLVQDISLTQWLALTPPSLVKAHLGFSDEMIGKLNKVKQEVV
ncbi:hypothetical protein H0H87_009492 [Tephrocybe sp. NHM501043]|nr:hypothetical protein H0H87_009492 [Tephrocybe sp. NHM501043]